jgi:hypothetical protein
LRDSGASGTGSSPAPGPRARRLRSAAVAAALVAAVAAVYGASGGYAFVFDDDGSLVNNPHVPHGLTLAGVRWAFTSFFWANWFPVTWVVHMLDVSLVGMDPGRQHLLSAAWHAAATLALLAALRRLTGALWPAAFVAGLFAVHPLHVESVAWLTERKDAVSALFWFLGMAAYARYAARPGPVRYVPVAAALALGLMTKQIVVTFPLVLLLLDWWPLGRLAPRGPGRTSPARLLLEKVPLLLLAAAGGVVAVFAQRSLGAVGSLATYRPAWRLANALSSCLLYLRDTVWPAHLAAYYPFRVGDRPPWQVAGSAALLAGITAVAFLLRRRRPALLAGWCWYLVTLLPVIGIVQVGSQSHADRYMYLPLVGLGVAAAWGVGGGPLPAAARPALAVGAVAALALLGVAAARQAETWRSPLSLYGRMLAVDPANWMGHHGYALAIEKQGRRQEALEHFRIAAHLNGASPEAQSNYGFALYDAGRTQEAIAQLGVSARVSPENADVHYYLGLLLARTGRVAEAKEAFRAALRARPGFVAARAALVQLGGVP